MRSPPPRAAADADQGSFVLSVHSGSRPPSRLRAWALVVVRLAAIAGLVAAVVVVESRHAPEHFRLVSIACVFLILVVSASLLRGRWRDGVLVLASLALGLCALEAAASWIEPRQNVVTTDGWNVRRAELGWGPGRAGVFHSESFDPKTGALIYSADYTIDDNLLRSTKSAASGPTIAFFGDSLTFGHGLGDADTLPQQFADLLPPDIRVLNLGFPGYGPQHFLRALETGMFDKTIGPNPKLFVFLTSPWHVERTACKALWVIDAPRYELKDGELTYKGACFEGWKLKARQFLAQSALYRLVVDPARRRTDRAEIDAYVAILGQAARLAREKYGVETLIPYLYADDAYMRGAGITNEEVMEMLRQNGARVVDVSLEAERRAGEALAIPGDGHPSALANRLRARLLKSYVSQDMSGVLVSKLD